MSGETKSSLKIIDRQRKGYDTSRNNNLVNTYQPSDFDTFEEWVEHCYLNGLSLRISENEFYAAKRRSQR